MKTNIHKKAALLVLSLATLAFTFTSCHKQEQRPQLNVIGGEEGTFGKDVDGDKDIDGSFFAIDVSIFRDGFAKGYFDCRMAGKWDFLGLPLMEVKGGVSNGSVNADKSVTFSGAGTVDLGDGKPYSNIPFIVRVTQGGPQVGTLTLTVIGLFDGVPGDTIAGNGNYDLLTETVAVGRIKFNH